MPNVSIIGTAGRHARDTAILNKSTFDLMIQRAEEIIRHVFHLEPQNTILVSGGSAWADHVAVQLYLQHLINDDQQPFNGLHLYVPCRFDKQGFADNGQQSWRSNPGKTLNMYHAAFSNKIGQSSFADIRCAHAMGAVIDGKHTGFHARNSAVAESEFLIAFTCSTPDIHRIQQTSKPSDGGTADTWNKCAGTKVHVPLHLVNQPITASCHPPVQSEQPLDTIRRYLSAHT